MIPKDWIEVDDKSQNLTCPFISENASKDQQDKCDRLIRGSKPPLKNWKKYTIDIRGCAGNVKEGLRRLDQLKAIDYVFSTSDEDLEDTVKKIKNYYLKKHGDKKKVIKDLLSSGSDVFSENSRKVKEKHRPKSKGHEDDGTDQEIGKEKKNIKKSNPKVQTDSCHSESDLEERNSDMEKTESDEELQKKSKKFAKKTKESDHEERNSDMETTESDKELQKKPKKFEKKTKGIPVSKGEQTITLYHLQNRLSKMEEEMKFIDITQKQMMDKLINIEHRLLKNDYRQVTLGQASFFKDLKCDSLEKFDDLDTRLEKDEEFKIQMQTNVAKFINTSKPIQRSIAEIYLTINNL
ncbi:uncharacterized protein LOC122849500 [Aphidius gifuensis]|uniref:uncharacterized protein LOC122849500 n=1 Tax=Aphidius gifuensis TaxID=684658 RepID=UPI001CDD757D|nr:uncharacterized protein LOC122849500 [Aphidius gifuensis]